MHLPVKTYKPVTILSENDIGQIGREYHKKLTEDQLDKRLRRLSLEGWEPTVVQIGEDQHDLPYNEWRDYALQQN